MTTNPVQQLKAEYDLARRQAWVYHQLVDAAGEFLCTLGKDHSDCEHAAKILAAGCAALELEFGIPEEPKDD